MRVSGRMETDLRGDDVTIAYTLEEPPGFSRSLVYVHGWGCSQRDFEGAAIDPVLSKYQRLSFDFPGHGESSSPKADISVSDVVAVMREVIRVSGVQTFTLIGHSTGALVAGRYAQLYPSGVTSLVNIEGNLQSQDCFLTGEVANNRQSRASFIDKFRGSNNAGFRRYAEGLARVDDQAFRALASSVVAECADNQPFVEFARLDRPKLFVYGSESKESISYLADLEGMAETEICEIPNANHFISVDNPVALYGAIGSFVRNLDALT